MAAAMKIKKGDTVQVLAGKDRGKQGRVVEARPSEGSVIVENLNIVKRHRKPAPVRDTSRMGGAQMTPGGIIEKPSPIDISNVMLVCPTCNQASRIGVHVKETKGETLRVRFCKRCNEEIDR
jgi:large subunit ribosomal protein L24